MASLLAQSEPLEIVGSAGALAVASAMMPSQRAAIAAYLLQHGSRMSHYDAGPRRQHGVSCARSLFDRFGRFPDQRNGEDSAFNTRLRPADLPITRACPGSGAGALAALLGAFRGPDAAEIATNPSRGPAPRQSGHRRSR